MVREFFNIFLKQERTNDPQPRHVPRLDDRPGNYPVVRWLLSTFQCLIDEIFPVKVDSGSTGPTFFSYSLPS